MLVLARSWWLVVLRGILLLLLGLAALIWPHMTLALLVLWIGAAFLVSGVFALAAAVVGRGIEGRGWLVLEGVLDVAAGIVTFLYPGITQVVLLAVVAGWAIITGMLQIVTAVRFRKVLRREWLLGLAGALAVLFGVLLIARPVAGLTTLTLLIGAFTIVYGAALIALGVRLRGLRQYVEAGIGRPSLGW